MVIQGGSELAGWEVASRPVPEALKPFVESWTGYREWSPAPVRRSELPTGRAVLVLELGPPVAIFDAAGAPQRIRGGFFAAIDDRVSVTETSRAQEGVQVNLTPRGARALAAVPMAEVARRVLPVEDLGIAAALAEQVALAPSWKTRFDVVAAALSRRFLVAPPLSDVVAWALGRIDARRGAVRIGALGAELGYSRKHLHERFLREVGIGPKRYAEVRRFERLARRLGAAAPGSLGAVALELGYADQAHLAREVRSFAGMTATALAAGLDDPLARAVRAGREGGEVSAVSAVRR
jgi:AraC-like DNA-binding protein